MALHLKPGIIPKEELIEHCKGVLAHAAYDASKMKSRKDKQEAKDGLIIWTSIIHHLSENQKISNDDHNNNEQTDK